MAAMMSSLSSPVLKEASFKGSFQPRVSSARRVALAPRTISCNAQKFEGVQPAAALAATALAVALSFGSVEPARADVAGLTPCSESKAFAKREKNELKAIDKRLKQYEAGSAPSLALQATAERTKSRFANYAKAGLLCGTDGLPHLISDPGLAIRYGHAGETLLPTVGFLYIAGWIGYTGRQYLILSKEESKPREKEIIIDVPLALKLSYQGAGWPFRAVRELLDGNLLEDDEKITVSPR